MRALIFLLGFMIVMFMMYDIFSLAKEGTRQIESVQDKSQLLSLIKVPPGMEFEYEMALSGYPPFDPKMRKVFEKRKKNSGENILAYKIKGYRLKNQNIFVDILAYNQSKTGKRIEMLKVSCVLKDKNSNILKKFTKKYEISINPNEAKIVKNINIGEIDEKTKKKAKKMRCKVTAY